MIIKEKFLNSSFYDIERFFSESINEETEKINIRIDRDGITLAQDTDGDYYTDSPYIELREGLKTKNITSLYFSTTEPTDTSIKAIPFIDGQAKKYAGGWNDISDISVSNASALSDISTNISDLFDGSTYKRFNLRFYLITTDEAATPTLLYYQVTAPDLYCTIFEVRDMLADLTEQSFNDIKIYNSIIDADKFVRIKTKNYIDYSSMTSTYEIVNHFSKLKTASIVLYKLYRTMSTTAESDEINKYSDMFFELLKELQNGEITVDGLTVDGVIIDDSRQGEFFGYRENGGYKEIDDETEFREEYFG